MADNAALDKLSIVVYAGEYDKIHYALAMAAAAGAIGREVTLFFTMDACNALGDDEAWRDLPVSQDKGADGRKNGGRMDDEYAALGIATFDSLLMACIELDVTFMVCEMGLRARDLEDMNLREDLAITQGGLVSFLQDATADGSIVFI